MDPNNKKDQKNNQNRNRNMRGVVTLIIWALVLTVVFALFHRQVFRIRLKHLPIFLGAGLISILLLSVVYFQCQTMCSLSVAAVLLYLAPSFVVLASAVLWKMPLTKGKIAALCVSLILNIGGCLSKSIFIAYLFLAANASPTGG